ncbi:hypothetical protein ANCCEY_02557 [Ancylostoma ceylanicum]|uniref:Tyrosine-protein kinase n=1 Tax=Ancylostoma ceylanicum TaxID=53326 RepID=A0A0D6MC56_9BILA|nr:hypothetical protein ANCCEY_02557 [Ancylostoma ceylanicum]
MNLSTERLVDTVSCSRSIVKSIIDPWLLNQNYYHGYLSKEDLPSLLFIHGDFLVRCTEGGKQKAREIIVSVMHDPEGKSKAADYDGRMEATTQDNDQTYYYFDSNTKFPSVEGLLLHHTEKPILVNEVEVLLKRGVRLAKWEYPTTAVQVGKLTGTGSFGEIRKGKLTRRDGQVVDVSVRMMKGRSEICKQQSRELVRQARLLRDLCHPNVLRFYGVCLLELPIFVLNELVSGGALDAYLLENKSTVDKDEKMQMMASAGWGIAFLHSNEILLRDIAAKNCLYTTNKMVLIYEIFACGEPYSKLTTTAAKEAIMAGELNPFPKDVPSQLTDYVKKKMWDMDPDKRATMEQVVKWVEGFTGLTLRIQKTIVVPQK